MYIIAVFGFLMMLLSVVMIVKPAYFAAGIVKFSEKSWFHPFEVIARFVFGLAFVWFAGQTALPVIDVSNWLCVDRRQSWFAFHPTFKTQRIRPMVSRKIRELFQMVRFGFPLLRRVFDLRGDLIRFNSYFSPQ